MNYKSLPIEEVKQRTNELLMQYQTAPDHLKRKLEETVYLLNIKLVYKTVKMVGTPPEKFDDKFQDASYGMLQAIRRWKPGNAAFSTYAVTTMKGQIQNGYRDNDWAMNVPRKDKERGLQIARIAHNPAQLEAIEESESEINRLLALINCQHPADLTNEYINNLAHDEEMDEESLKAAELSDIIFDSCTPNEIAVLSDHFLEGYSVEEIAVANITSFDKINNTIKDVLERFKPVLSNN